MVKRKVVSDYMESLLEAEVCGRCPRCNLFSEEGRPLTNHHINHDASVGEYWNLIRICDHCHNEVDGSQNSREDKRIRQIKSFLFRRLVGSASYEVLLLAGEYKITSTLPCLARPLLKLGLIKIEQENSFHVGLANHPTIGDYRITLRGVQAIKELKLR